MFENKHQILRKKNCWISRQITLISRVYRLQRVVSPSEFQHQLNPQNYFNSTVSRTQIQFQA